MAKKGSCAKTPRFGKKGDQKPKRRNRPMRKAIKNRKKH